MKQAAGCILTTGAQVLICHARRGVDPPKDWYDTNWTVPKGVIEPGETPWTTANRELYEETGINFYTYLDPPEQNPELIRYKVGSNKLVTVFVCFVSEDILGHKLQCISMVDTDCPWKGLSEVDNYMWVTFGEAKDMVYMSQKCLFDEGNINKLKRS